MNRDNLLKLAVYLESLPEDYEEFDMAHFYNYHQGGWVGESDLIDYAQNNTQPQCGTVACALGHGPAAGIKVDVSTLNTGLGCHFWMGYCQQAFGFDWHSNKAKFLFSGNWSEWDPHHYGAAARIRYVLDENPIPTDEWEGEFDLDALDPYDVMKSYEGYRKC